MSLVNATSVGDVLFTLELINLGYNVAGGNVVNLLGGNDSIYHALNDTIFGGEGDDIIEGGAGVNLLDGGAGTDTYGAQTFLDEVTISLSGTDLVFTEVIAGNTLVNRIRNFETIYFNPTLTMSYDAVVDYISQTQVGLSTFDADNLVLTSLNDRISGLDGDDYIDAVTGNDTINGNSGFDTIIGGIGADVLRGGRDADRVLGDAEADWINGNNANDTVYGGTGNDTLRGGKENDLIFGESGNDSLYGDMGSDTITGGTGADYFYINGIAASDQIADFIVGEDKLVFIGVSGVSASLSGTDFIATYTDASGTTQTITLAGVTADPSGDFIFA